MQYIITEVGGSEPETAAEIIRFNSMVPETFPPLKPHHLTEGFWFFMMHEGTAIAFGGMVPFFEPEDGVGYMKRAYVLPDHRSRGLQLLLLTARETRARQIGWRMLVSECAGDNRASASSFFRAGFAQFEPEQPWGKAGDIYWRKTLA